MKPLDQVIRRWIAPTLTTAGFARKGRGFFVEGDDGSTGEVEVSPFALGQNEAEFHVDFFVSPRVWAEFRLQKDGVVNSALWEERLRGARDGTPQDTLWSFDPGDEEAGVRLQDAVRVQCSEQLALLDQSKLLEYCQRPFKESRAVTVRREIAVSALLAARGPSAALDRSLAALGQDSEWRDFDEKFIAFIREWLEGLP